ncbi:MAG TPA: hypothetical protein VGQ69_05290 [Gemmatimonadales bacterium]|nr:hypothetical protein [Gemmatimonadales bacterium]
MRTPLRLAPLALLLVGACASAKGRAESDVAAAERALAALPADAMKVVPDQVAPLTDAVNQGKDQLAKGDYAAASTSVREVPAQAQLVADSLPARKAALTAQMDTLAVALPRNLAAIKAKLDSIDKSKRLPRGLDEQELQEAKDTYAAVSAEWTEVKNSVQAGELASAMARAQNLKARVSRSLMALGLVADERAWSNVTLPPQ